MKPTWVTPEQLAEDPQLAVLSALDHLLQQCIYALMAAHPELAAGTGADTYGATASEVWLADALCDHFTALQHAIARYRELVQRQSGSRQ
jgi:hypothetical protein